MNKRTCNQHFGSSKGDVQSQWSYAPEQLCQAPLGQPFGHLLQKNLKIDDLKLSKYLNEEAFKGTFKCKAVVMVECE